MVKISAGRTGFLAAKFAATDPVPWQTEPSRQSREQSQPDDCLFYKPRGDELIGVDEQSDLAIAFLKRYRSSVVRLNALKVDVHVELCKRISAHPQVDITVLPRRLVSLAVDLQVRIHLWNHVLQPVSLPARD
jgi:hypothetical protein